MELNNLFRVSAVAATVALTACGGGDINLEVSNVNTGVVADSGDSDSNVDDNPCASYVDEAGATQQGAVEGNNCRYTALFVSSSNEILTDVTFNVLENDGAHLFNESLYVGENYVSLSEAADAGITEGGDGPTLFIEAGATLGFQANRALVVNRGAQISAQGAANAPITITSETDVNDLVTPEQTEEWGGIVINGFGFTNACQYNSGWNFQPNTGNATPLTLADNTECSIAVEGLVGNDQSNFGGALPEDSSGILNYVVVKHAGSALSPGNELNGITFGAVGSGTSLSNIEIYANIDDGIEFFGGGADLTNYVAVYIQDDSIDIDDGYYGTINNALVVQGGGTDVSVGTRTGAHCVESDGASARNENDVFAEDYLSRGTINNLTCISSAKNRSTAGNGDGGAGVNFEEGHLISVNNSIITTAYAGDDSVENDNYCFQAEDDIDATQLAAGLLTFEGNIFACPDLTANSAREELNFDTVDTSSEQYATALSRRADDAAGPFSGPAVNFLTDTGNVLSNATVRADEGVTTNILNGFLAVPVADILVEGTSLPDGFAQPGATFTNDDLVWTFGLLEGARSQALWFEDGQVAGER
ncbi:hypothetical protein J3L16_01965 [Alteromonas sp. 5E99-2]|uniref:hypothetical protein n=1 Tax=Alteromonas sp. 5E99-2 TaxID=2817683 RepID=UPI001A984882|nr:hypothetical protein [Alteromonas sp. 5E99-2]MBO1254447.1 hypothetical protein [Alteromonas sp. 5E99-2]